MLPVKCLAAATLLACAVFAADDPSPRLVTLNFAAIDADGRPVTDLTAAEVQISDQGKPAQLAAFRNEALRTAPAAREISNRPPAALSHIQVIVFDLLNLSTSSRKPAIDQLARALEKLETKEQIYLYLLNIEGELDPVRALPQTPAAAAPWAREITPVIEKAVGSVMTIHREIATDTALRVKKTYAALDTVGQRLAPMPGHKNILWVTFGVPCDLPQAGGQIWDCRPTLGLLTTTLAAANVSVSPIALQAAAIEPENTVTMQAMVDSTGGRFYSGGDIERAIPDAVDLARSSYRAQYIPPSNNWDGKLHKLRATSSRKGVTLLARQSYTAAKAPEPFNEKQRNQAAFQSSFDGSEIALNVTASPGAQPKTLHLRIGIDMQDLLLQSRDGRFSGQLTSYVAAYLPDNHIQEYPPLPVNLNWTPEQHDKMGIDGIHLGQDVLVPDGVATIRLLLIDKLAGTSGAVTIPVR